MNYKNIERAYLEIAYDNGGINRERSEEVALNELRTWLRDYLGSSRLRVIDTWLETLNEEQLSALCCGSEEEQEQVLVEGEVPPLANALLNEIFDNIC